MSNGFVAAKVSSCEGFQMLAGRDGVAGCTAGV